MYNIELINLIWMVIPLIIVGFFYAKWIENKKEIVWASSRMVVQLIICGYVLNTLFSQESSWVALAVITVMAGFSTFTALRPLDNKLKTKQSYTLVLISLLISACLHLFLMLQLIIKDDPWYSLHRLIPLSGMVFSTGMNALAIGIERFSKAYEDTCDFIDSRKQGFKAALIPQINSLMVVGLVSLPGMMTGQILSGVDPLIAVRYQIMIMAMLLGNSGICLIIYFSLKEKILSNSKINTFK